jgi:hypothetical protein
MKLFNKETRKQEFRGSILENYGVVKMLVCQWEDIFSMVKIW